MEPRDNGPWISNAMLINYLPEDLHDLILDIIDDVDGIWLMWVGERGLQPVIWPGLQSYGDDRQWASGPGSAS